MKKEKMKTAVSPHLRFLTVCLLSLLSLVSVTRLMAQAIPPLPDFVITEPQLTDEVGSDAMQLTFVGLNQDENDEFLPVTNLMVTPQDQSSSIHIVSAEVTPLTNAPFYITLLVDTSGSMRDNLQAIKSRLLFAFQQAPDNAHVSVVGFNGQIRAEQFTAFTNDKTAVLQQIARLESNDGSTCLGDVVYTAVQSLSHLPQNTRRGIILITDGVDEIIRGRPEPCSSSHSYTEAVYLASHEKQTIPIPLHTFLIPYDDGEMVQTLPGPNTLREGLLIELDEKNYTTGENNRWRSIPIAVAAIMESFTYQWEAAITLYAPSGQHTLDLTPIVTEGHKPETQPLTFNTNFTHFPAPIPEDLTIQSLVYDEAKQAFNIEFSLCRGGGVYCDPARTDNLDLLIEDTFTHKLTRQTYSPGQFQPITQTQDIASPHISLQSEHYYLMRLTAQNGVTDANYHPFDEVVFAYQPHLEVQVKNAQLDRFALQPDLVVSLIATRTDVVQASPPTFVLEGVERPLFTQIIPQQPAKLWVSGYLHYKGSDSHNEIYALPTHTAEPHSPITVTFPAAAGGGYADYDMFLTVADGRDGFSTRVQVTNLSLQPQHWWGYPLRQVRRVLANPLIFVAAILLALLLLGLIRLTTWLARRMVQPAEPQKAPPPKPELPPVAIHVDATPDDAVRYQTIPLPVGKFIIGRRLDCDLTVRDDQLLAEQHAELRRENGSIYLVNCDPDHSTFINNNEIISGVPIPIHHGDKIRLGAHTRLTLQLPEESEDMD